MDLTTIIPNLFEAALSGDRRRLEVLALSTIRKLKKSNPDIAAKLSSILANANYSATPMRGRTIEPAPADADIGLALVRVFAPEGATEPVLQEDVKERACRFLSERMNSGTLLAEGFSPPGLLLLKGVPGTGKTMLARWLADSLHLNMVVLDLSTSISSFLGKTGNNLRRSFDYARSAPCLLLLDEFDAIGKRRDDSSEVGELKRIVNVLLKEMEDWPLQSVLVAATNHPELLDPAIHRRFDMVLDIPLPGLTQRKAIILRGCGQFGSMLSERMLTVFSHLCDGMSGSDIETATRAAVRRHLLDKSTLENCIVDEVRARAIPKLSAKQKRAIIEMLSDGDGLTMSKIADVIGAAKSTVHYHIHKENENG